MSDYTSIRVRRDTFEEVNQLQKRTKLAKAELIRQAVELLKNSTTPLGAETIKAQPTAQTQPTH